jgi:hypothetical protein
MYSVMDEVYLPRTHGTIEQGLAPVPCITSYNLAMILLARDSVYRITRQGNAEMPGIPRGKFVGSCTFGRC